MCGFVGFVSSQPPQTLNAMLKAIAHRGPNGEGAYRAPDGRFQVAHARLAIIDPAGGAQPITASNGITIAFNGMIYNYRELAADLAAKGVSFTTRTDTEVLLQAYRAWGEGCLEKLRGMFSFVIYDPLRRTLFFARDPLGKKPLYYFHHAHDLVFASELKGLLPHPAVPRAIDHNALRRYFAYGYVPAPYTMLQGVKKLPAGHAMTYRLDDNTLVIRQYWTPDLTEGKHAVPANEQEAAAALERLFSKAVRKRLISDVPAGIFLSGGIDSSAVAAFAARHLGASNVETFSIGFEEKSFDESAFARLAARHIGSRHHETFFTQRQLADTVPQVLGRLDEPMADPSILPTYLLCRSAKERITVALAGDGADELFAGYGPFTAAIAGRWLDHTLPSFAIRTMERAAALLPSFDSYMSFDFKLKRFLMGMRYPASVRHHVWMAPLPPAMMAELFGGEPSISVYDGISALLDEYRGGGDEISRGIYLFLKTYLQDDILTKVDRASMMTGIEVRAPFLDLDLVEYVNSLSPALKFRHMSGKRLLKNMLAPHLPREILHRPKKGFGIPMSAWLRTGLRGPLEDALDPQWLGGLGIDPKAAATAAGRHLAGKSDERLFLWALICLRTWQRSIMTGAAS